MYEHWRQCHSRRAETGREGGDDVAVTAWRKTLEGTARVPEDGGLGLDASELIVFDGKYLSVVGMVTGR